MNGCFYLTQHAIKGLIDFSKIRRISVSIANDLDYRAQNGYQLAAIYPPIIIQYLIPDLLPLLCLGLCPPIPIWSHDHGL